MSVLEHLFVSCQATISACKTVLSDLITDMIRF